MENKINIVLVEDNEGDILLTMDAFEESSLQTNIIVLKNGKEAIDFFSDKNTSNSFIKPDLVLLDINIPIFNGHDVLSHIKESNLYKDTPVIILSTSSNETDIRKAYFNHANCYIIKPLEFEDFLTTISKIEDFWLSLCKLPSKI
jgi:CheY-like chemotaxis protein